MMTAASRFFFLFVALIVCVFFISPFPTLVAMDPGAFPALRYLRLNEKAISKPEDLAALQEKIEKVVIRKSRTLQGRS